jgi:hypothetical protein
MTSQATNPIDTGSRRSLLGLIRAVGGSQKRRGQDIWDTIDGDVFEIRAHGAELGIFKV